MLDIKLLFIYFFIASIAYKFFLFPKKIFTLRGIQLLSLVAVYILFLLKILPYSELIFVLLSLSYYIFVFYPQYLAKKILNMLITYEGRSDFIIEKKLEA